MIRRITAIGLMVAMSAAFLPTDALADEARPLASLRTAEGLNNALQAAGAANAQDPTRRAGSGVQVLRQQGGNFFESTTGRVALVAIIAVAVGTIAYAWDKPGARSADERND